MDIQVVGRFSMVLCALILSPALYASSIDYLILEARAKADKGHFERAAVAYQQVLEVDDTHPEARIGLANALMNAQIKEPYAEQSDALSVVLAQDKSKSPLLISQMSLGFLENAALDSIDQSLKEEVLYSLNQLQMGEHDRAIKTLDRIQKKVPEHPVPYNLLGMAWQSKGNPSKARDYFEKALSIKQDFNSARINLAELQIHLGEFDSATKELNKVLAFDKSNQRACLVMAHLSSLTGKHEEAKRWYKKAVELL